MSYLLCSFYSPPSVYFSFILITLNIFPRFFLLWTCCAVEHWAWPRLWFIHEVQWGRPLMSMNYLKATLFWIIPHFGKYFPTLPHQVVNIVEGCGMVTHGQMYCKRHEWKGTQMVSTDENAQGCYCISYFNSTILHIFLTSLSVFFWSML